MSVISSVFHLFLSTTPFLLLFSYFLYAAAKRPQLIQEYYNKINNNNQNNQAAQEELDDEVFVSLSSMLDTFLATLVLWSSLIVYLTFFVSKRRNLMERYFSTSTNKNSITTSTEPRVTQVIGNVYYEHPKGCAKICNRMHRTDIAYVTYPYPNQTNMNDNDNERNVNMGIYDNKIVQKKIRTYHQYHREKVGVLILPNKPLSGQPLADVERDVLSFQSDYAVRNKSNMTKVLIVCIFWVLFSTIGSLYILNQISAVNNVGQAENDEASEDLDSAWRNFWIVVFIGLPVIAGGANAVQWFLYKRWITESGLILDVGESTKVPPSAIQPEELHNDEEGGFSLFS